MLRPTIRSDARIIVDRAVTQARSELAPAIGAAGGGGAPVGPPGDFTVPGVDGEGNTITLTPFLLDVDAMDDAHVLLG